MADHGNPNIAEYGKGTQFGDGQDAAAVGIKAEPWSMRNAIRRIAAMDKETLKEFTNDPRLTMAQKAALKKFQLGVTNGNVKALKELEDSIDGKLVEKKVEIRTDSYAALVAEAAAMARGDHDKPKQ